MMVVRVYAGYGGSTPQPIETRTCSVPELGAELMSLFLLHGSIPLVVLFKKGVKHSECVVIVQKTDRRKTL